MTTITRRRAATLLAALPLAGACGEQQLETSALTPDDVDPAPQTPEVQSAALSDDELAMIAAMAEEFEVPEGWRGIGGEVDATPTSDEVLRKGMNETVKDTYARLRGLNPANGNKREDYFTWAEDKDSVDYHHFFAMGPTVAAGAGTVSTGFDDSPFDLTHDVLIRIAKANAFGIPTGAGARKVVFGLRGCAIDGDGGRTLGPSVPLVEAVPNHNTYRCVIGVWDPATRQVAAFKSSTVPLEVHLAVYHRWLQERAKDPKTPVWELTACMIPQGLHTKRVGVMKGKYPVTLRQESPMPVLREEDWTRNTLSLASKWDPPANITPGYNQCHIHVSINAQWANAEYQFSSQGCQTIDGWYDADTQPRGEIAGFNDAMGFEKANGLLKSKSNGEVVQFMMVTGREARLHAAGADEKAMRRVRIGSTSAGPDDVVVRLNRVIGAGANKATFDHSSMLKLVAYQKQQENYEGVKPDGIYGPVAAATGRFAGATFPA